MPLPGIQLIERSVRELTAPLADFFDSRHETVRRSTHEPTALEIASPVPETLNRAIGWTGSHLQSEQIQIAVDLLQRWRGRGSDLLVDDLENAARFPTRMRSDWQCSYRGSAEKIHLQTYQPDPAIPSSQFQEEKISLELLRDQPSRNLPSQIAATIRWEHGERCSSEQVLRQRWWGVENAIRGFSGLDLPEVFRAPRYHGDTESGRQITVAEGMELRYRPFIAGYAQTGVPCELFRGSIESRSLDRILNALAIQPIMESEGLRRGFDRYLTTLATPDSSILNLASIAAEKYHGLVSIRFSLLRSAGWEETIPPRGEVAIQFRNLTARQELRIGDRQNDRHQLSIVLVPDSGHTRILPTAKEFAATPLARQLESLPGLVLDPV